MKKFGGYFVFFGIGSILLHFVGLQFFLMSWFGSWGEMTAWEIRIAFVVIGGLMVWWVKRNEYV